MKGRGYILSTYATMPYRLFKEKKTHTHTTGRLTVASISHSIHFILPSGDAKTLPTILPKLSVHARTTVKRLESDIVALRILMHVSSLRGFRCPFVSVSVP